MQTQSRLNPPANIIVLLTPSQRKKSMAEYKTPIPFLTLPAREFPRTRQQTGHFGGRVALREEVSFAAIWAAALAALGLALRVLM